MVSSLAKPPVSFMNEMNVVVESSTRCPFSPTKQQIMQPKPVGYGDNFTAKCGHCDEIQVNGIHAHSAMFSKSKHNRVGCHGN